MTQFLVESDIRRTRFILESTSVLDTVARSVLNEGVEYNRYLELNEAPIGDVIGKIKTSISKMPRAAAIKAAQVVKKLPKTALPIAASILMSVIAQGANAQTSTDDMLAKLDALQSQVTQDLGDLKQQGVGDFGMDSSTQTTDAAPAADVEVTRDQLKALHSKLGGGSQPTLTALIKNGVDTDKVKKILTKMNLTDPMYIETALQQIQGKDLLPMIQWIAQVN